MEDRWDVLVVGGGPAGAIASYLLKQRYSRRVLLLEKETFPRLKPCAGGIAPRTELLLRELDLWSRIEPHRYLITSAELLTPNGTSINLRGEATASVMHRPLFDNILLDIAKDAGVHVLEGVKADSFIYAEGNRGGGRKPTAQTAAAEAARNVAGLRCGDDSYYADIIVIANGATTTFRTRDPRKEHITSCTAWFKHCSFTPGRIQMVFPPELSPHYGWLFPESDDRCNIGFCIKNNNLRGRKVSNRKVTDLYPLILDRYFREVIKGAEMVIPPKVFPMFPSRDIGTGALPGTVLVGDAARCINSYTGEGISYAVESGMIAAECIADFFYEGRSWEELDRTYVARIKRELGPGLRGGRFLSTFSPVLLRSFGLFSRIPVIGRLIPRMMTKMKA